MSTLYKVLIIALLFSLSSSNAARSHPAFHPPTSMNALPQGVEAQHKGMEHSCDAADEDCLMRRTGDAHLDYIYTQKLKP